MVFCTEPPGGQTTSKFKNPLPIHKPQIYIQKLQISISKTILIKILFANNITVFVTVPF